MIFRPSQRRYVFGLIAAAMATAGQGQAYQPSFHPDRLKGPPVGAPNDVMILASPHLSELPNTFAPNMVTPLLKRLASWQPTAIATEDMSGLQCDSLRRYPPRYAETIENYCGDPSAGTAATGLDVPAANAEAERVLATWPAQPSAAQRRHLAAIFWAAGERPSALVQWLRLPLAQRKAGDGLNDQLVGLLNAFKDRRNETSLIAAPLAAQLGLERLWSVDDHSADSAPADEKAYGLAIESAWDNDATKARIAMSERLNAGLTQADGLLNIYRAYNQLDAAMLVYQSDFGAALTEPSPQAFGRNYVGYWETRNLRMVANIRDILGLYPATRMLAIVGASHKGYYEAYLNQMHDVRLVDVNSLLK